MNEEFWKIQKYYEDWVKGQAVPGHKSQYQIDKENQSKDTD